MRRHDTTRTLFGACLASALLTLAAGAQDEAPLEEVSMLRLYDGNVLWGAVAGHDAETLHFTRLDNGGRVKVPWNRLDPALSDELLERYGYIDHSSDELMIEADKLTLDDGQDVIGKIVNRTDDAIYVKNSTAVVPVPKTRIRGAASVVQVPALDVYTREELYQQEASKLDTASAEGHYELAKFCEQIFDFDNALLHYKAAKALPSELEAEVVDGDIRRATVKSENQIQIEALREADHLRARGKYDLAIDLLTSFPEIYPESPLRSDAAKKKVQVEKAREKALRSEVVDSWHTWSRRLTTNAARNPELTFEAAMDWLDEGLRQEILDASLKDLQRRISTSLEPDRITRYWNEREGGRRKKASYGAGTWMLGEGDARAGLETAEEKAGPATEKSSERAALEERIKRYLKNQEMVRKAKSDTGDEGDAAKFWREWTSQGRAQWMLAYYVENGGDMRVLDVRFSNCPECNGTGVREIINTGSARSGSEGAGAQLIECPLCHHVGIQRTVSYR